MFNGVYVEGIGCSRVNVGEFQGFDGPPPPVGQGPCCFDERRSPSEIKCKKFGEFMFEGTGSIERWR